MVHVLLQAWTLQMRNKDHPTPNVSGGKMMGFALNVGSSLVLGGGVSNNQ